MVKPGAAVLDVGVARVDGKLAGDVHESVYDVAAWVSPNPGGVGPMTRAMLLSNVVERAEADLELGSDRGRRERHLVSSPQEPRRVPSTLGGLVYLIVVALSIVGLLVVAVRALAPRRLADRRGLLLGALTRACCGTATPGCCAYAATGGSTYSCSAASGPP